MELQILDKNFNLVDYLDTFDSVIWANRSKGAGDCEIYCIASDKNRAMLQHGYYITRLDDDMTCIIERISDVSNVDEGNYLTVVGRDLKSILSRRVVWEQTQLSGTVENCIRRLINENIINPTNPTRQIPNFVLADAHSYTDTMEKQLTGDNLLTAIEEICAAYDYGFSIKLQGDKFVFDLTKGIDRSWEQNEVPFVLFSATFDNLITSDYTRDQTEQCNIALVAGEGEGKDRTTVTTYSGNEPAGLERRELYVDARDLSTNNGEVSAATYSAQLQQRGREGLAERLEQILFESEIEATGQYQYRKDYFLHDIVQIQANNGIEAQVRIVEIVETQDASGYNLRPTFEITEV